jgi:hypothetical protein
MAVTANSYDITDDIQQAAAAFHSDAIIDSSTVNTHTMKYVAAITKRH